MSATITLTSLGVLVNQQLTLADFHELYDILDAEPDFAGRLSEAIAGKFESLCEEHAEAFRLTGGGRADLVMAYLNQMNMCTTLLTVMYPNYRKQVEAAEAV